MAIRDSRVYFDCDHCGSNVFARPKAIEIRDKTLIVCEHCYNQLGHNQSEKGGIS